MAHLENKIQALSDGEFLHLMQWMEERHLDRLAVDGFEAPELEAALLRTGRAMSGTGRCGRASVRVGTWHIMDEGE